MGLTCMPLNVLVEHASQIEGVDPDNARVVIKLAIGGQTVTISQYGIKLVDRKEYERNSKDLSEYWHIFDTVWHDLLSLINLV